MRKVIKIFIIFTIGFNCIACNPKHNDYSISVIDTSSTTNKSQITFKLIFTYFFNNLQINLFYIKYIITRVIYDMCCI